MNRWITAVLALLTLAACVGTTQTSKPSTQPPVVAATPTTEPTPIPTILVGLTHYTYFQINTSEFKGTDLVVSGRIYPDPDNHNVSHSGSRNFRVYPECRNAVLDYIDRQINTSNKFRFGVEEHQGESVLVWVRVLDTNLTSLGGNAYRCEPHK